MQKKEAQYELQGWAKNLTQTFLAGSISILSFTLGYLHAFRVPEAPTLSQAGYFFLSIVHRSVSSLIWQFFLLGTRNTWLGIIVVIVFTLSLPWRTLGNKLAHYSWSHRICKIVRDSWKSLKKYLSLHRIKLISYALGVLSAGLILAIRRLNYYDGIDIYVGNTPGTMIPFARVLFVMTLFSSTFIVPVWLLVDGFFGASIGMPLRYRRIILLIVIIVSMALAYEVGDRFSGAYLQFQTVRLSDHSTQEFPLIWKTEQTIYVLDCVDEGEWTIKGVSDGETSYVASVDRFKLRGTCPGTR